MIVRHSSLISPVNWGHGLSWRLLVASDGMGFTITDTIVNAGTSSALQYGRHLEACYCIQGTGQVESVADGTRHGLEPGVMYALHEHEPHWLTADPEEDLRLICVFAPALSGDERHDLLGRGFSSY